MAEARRAIAAASLPGESRPLLRFRDAVRTGRLNARAVN